MFCIIDLIMETKIHPNFIRWFFAENPRRLFQILGNFLLWGWHFFSIGYFAPRIFSPWHRDITGYGRGFDLRRFFHALGWNLISRVIGAVLRIAVMIAGLLVEFALLAAGSLALVIWYALPLLIPAFLVMGIITLFAAV